MNSINVYIQRRTKLLMKFLGKGDLEENSSANDFPIIALICIVIRANQLVSLRDSGPIETKQWAITGVLRCIHCVVSIK